MADLLLLPLPAVRHVLGNHIEVETRARTKYVVGTLSSVSLDGFDVARDDGVLVHFTWQQVTAAIVGLDSAPRRPTGPELGPSRTSPHAERR